VEESPPSLFTQCGSTHMESVDILFRIFCASSNTADGLRLRQDFKSSRLCSNVGIDCNSATTCSGIRDSRLAAVETHEKDVMV